ncbi:MAG: TIR domain-containing protein [Armatimonadota bacterium]|jgi:hypothetical protein|nr:TIR domain-containing protein [Fimbriimonadaceae bacterium]
MATKHKCFISYHHANDQIYKDALAAFNKQHDIFIDMSVDSGDIDDTLDDQAIREKIRDEYLRDATVTILLVGTETKFRKHVDWELFSSMIDGKLNKKSGVLVVQLPTTKGTYHTAAHGEKEKESVYPATTVWTTVDSRAEYERRYPYLPDRIIDNLLSGKAKISVTTWDKLTVVSMLKLLIDLTFEDRASAVYDLSRTMRRRNG